MTAATIAVILAGGGGRRLGGVDKALLRLVDRPLLQHVVDRIGPQVDALLISAGGDASRFRDFGLRVVADDPHATPANGVLVGLTTVFRRFREEADADGCRVLSVPVDTPFLPRDLVTRLAERAAGDARTVAFAAAAGRDHPIIALWPPEARQDAAAVFDAEPEISVHGLMRRLRGSRVDFAEAADSCFLNVNAREDLVRAAQRIRR